MSLRLSKNSYLIKLKLAVISRFEFKVTFSGFFVEPLDQETKLYPELGVAVILIDVPSLYVPPAVETLPPSPAVTVRVYWVTVGVGLVVFDGGATYTDELSSVLSFAQVISNKSDK